MDEIYLSVSYVLLPAALSKVMMDSNPTRLNKSIGVMPPAATWSLPVFLSDWKASRSAWTMGTTDANENTKSFK